MSPGRNLVLISRQRLVGSTNGSSAYLLDLATAARAAGYVPHLIQPSPSLMGRWPLLKLKPEMKVFGSHHLRGLVRIGPYVISTSPKLYVALAWTLFTMVARKLGAKGAWAQDKPAPHSIAVPWTRSDHDFVAHASKGKADLAIADYMFCAEGFADLPAGTPTAIVMHDLFSSRPGDVVDSLAKIDQKTELAMLDKADVLIAIQADEARFIEQNLPGKRAILAPLAIKARSAPQPGLDGRLLFVGSNAPANIAGLRWFFNEVWPRVQKLNPAITLTIAGAVSRRFPEGGPAGVAFLGPVDDLAALYADAGVVISPLTFGSGLKIKLVEAMAAGKAVVATSITLQGLDQTARAALEAHDDPEGFAAAIATLAIDGATRERLGTAALNFARLHFSPEACHADFAAWLGAPRERCMTRSRQPAGRNGSAAALVAIHR